MVRLRSCRSRAGSISFACLLAMALPVALYAHLALSSSAPLAGAAMSRVPSEIRLTFTEPVERPLSSIVLSGPGGDVALGALTASENGLEIWSSVVGGMPPGPYTVQWQAVGRDGHPVRGEFVFSVEEGAEGIPVSAPPPEIVPIAQPEQLTFDSRSPLYAAVRGLTYLGIVGSVGVAVFILLLTRLGQGPTATLPASFRSGATGTASRLGLFAVILLAASMLLRLQAQSHALFGSGVSGENFSLMMHSTWGTAWLIQAGAGAVVLLGLIAGFRSPGLGLSLAVPGVIAMALSPALAGHAATSESFQFLAILSDGLHVLAAGAWLGTLFVFVTVGTPHLRKLTDAERPGAYKALLRAFSSVALVSGGIIAATGVFAAVLQLERPADLWESTYGSVLFIKLLFVLMIFGVGAYNWRTLTNDQTGTRGELALRRSGAVELMMALLVIAVTAVLVAIPPPAR